MATFVLVHGGGHGGWCWDFVASNLRAQGHCVHAPTLTGLGESRHEARADISLDSHVEDLLTLLWDEHLEDVILVGHSYGGMVISGAADRAANRIRRLVFLDAAIPADGECLFDISPGLQSFNDVQVVDGVRLGLWPGPALVRQLYGIADEKLASWALARLTPHPWNTFETRLALSNPEAFARIPRAIINCAATLERRPEAIRARWRDGDHVRQVEAGHDVMITDADLVTGLLLEIAGL
ncbi:alpha/beta fold hydrolase [Novosphingobium aquae]|uniref:Alpha/beta fold hydrolase n=1 Tax=Novosphingobium aquae TaxID=3133435 RepID=A0ABU8SCG9_9SPHN